MRCKFTATFALSLMLLHPAQAAEKETAFERVMRTNTLRCSYVVLPPQMSLDANTHQLSGVSYDITMAAAKKLGLKVEWKEEVNFATMAEGFKTGRYDAFCFTGYRWPPAARAMEYSEPVFYSRTDIYVRAEDTRFDKGLDLVNTPNVTIATIDGEAAQFIRDEMFPKSKIYSMAQSTDLGQLFEAVATKKADVAFNNPIVVMPYMLTKPGTIKRIETAKPLRSYAHAFAFGKGEHDLVSLFNVALDEMINSGEVDAILDKYEKIPHSFIRVKSPVRE